MTSLNAPWSTREEQILRAIDGTLFPSLLESILRRARLPEALRAALSEAFLQPLPAFQVPKSERPPFRRTVKGIGRHLGRSPTYLSKVASVNGFSLYRTLQWMVFLKGSLIHRPPEVGWSQVSSLLGFRDPSSWSHFVRRLTGMTPTDAMATPVRIWAKRMTEEAFEKS